MRCSSAGIYGYIHVAPHTLVNGVEYIPQPGDIVRNLSIHMAAASQMGMDHGTLFIGTLEGTAVNILMQT